MGMNTPGIIKYPFWRITKRKKNALYVCMNKGEAWAPQEIEKQSLCLDMDLAKGLREIEKQANRKEGREYELMGVC